MSKKEIAFDARPAAKKAPPLSQEQWVRSGQVVHVRRFTFDLPAELHTAFKARCVHEGVTMQDKIRFFIEAELARTD